MVMKTKAAYPILRKKRIKRLPLSSSASSIRWKRRQLYLIIIMATMATAVSGLLWFISRSLLFSNSSDSFGVAVSSLLLLHSNISSSSSSKSSSKSSSILPAPSDISSQQQQQQRQQQQGKTKTKETDIDKINFNNEDEKSRDMASIIGTPRDDDDDDFVGNSESSLTVNGNNIRNNSRRQPLAVITRPSLIKTISMPTTSTTDVEDESWSGSNNQQPIANNTQHGTTRITMRNSNNQKHDVEVDSSEDDFITTTTKSFYRWESDNNDDGIPIQPLWHYMHSLALPNIPRDPFGPVPAYIDRHATLTASRRVYPIRCDTVLRRAMYVGPFFQDALYHFYNRSSSDHLYNNNKTQAMFPFLSRALLRDGGLPLVFNFQDYQGCCHRNYNYTPPGTKNVSTVLANIPMLTMSYSPRCGYAFPIPSYTTLKLAKKHPHEWNAAFDQSDAQYPWHAKIKKAVWRGILSDRNQVNQSLLDIPRLQMNFLAKQHPEVFDVAIPCTPVSKCPDIQRRWRKYLILGGYMPFADFQNYRAVLDLDGCSWSERFPRLLCQNSVVIKLDPGQIDYFWPTLRAGVHYVAANLANLVSVVQYVTSDAHQTEMQTIVANAREWCQQHMTVRQIQWDILSLLDSYAQELYKGDSHWYRHVTRINKLNFVRPLKWQKHPVSAWNRTF